MEELYQFSKHALEQMELRGISKMIVLDVLHRPYLEQWQDDGQSVYSQIVTFDDGDYLVRVFVNANEDPPLVKTVYRTSKIKKYLQ